MDWQRLPSSPSNRPAPRLSAVRSHLSGPEDFRNAATFLASRALRVLAICTHELESPVFEYQPFVDAIKRFILAPSFCKVRVLVMDPGRVTYHRHAFILLARKLTSHVEIRNCAPDQRACPANYIVADRCSTLYRMRHERWDALCDLEDRAVASLHLERFDALWTASNVQRKHLAIHI